MFYSATSISASQSSICIQGELYHFKSPRVMGILNITPDSFYDGGQFAQVDDAVARVAQMLNDGADIIDIGAASSRPGAALISVEEELYRLRNVLEELRRSFPDAIFSIDTYNAQTAKAVVLEYGVDIINDISAGELDSEMFNTVADLKVPYVMMHMKGDPASMQSDVHYENMVMDIFGYFTDKITRLRKLGVNDVILDPGFGFAKSIADNFELLSRLNDFKIFELPLMTGISRKSMIFKTIGATAEDSLNATTATHMVCLLNGANILRVHDVKEAKECITIFNQLVNKEA